MPAILLSLVLCLWALHSPAQYVYDYNERCQNAYEAYLSLNLAEGSQLVRQEIRQNPYNLMATFLGNYEDCLLLVFNADRAEFDQRRGHLDERLRLISKGPTKTPWYRFCKATLYLHWTMVYIRMGDNLKAAFAFRKSLLLAKENQRLFPNFKQNNIILGIQETAAGTVPEDYQWLASLFGLRGSVRNGIERLSTFTRETDAAAPFHAEAVVYELYLKFYLQSRQADVWQYVNSPSFSTKNNLLNAFIRANIGLNYRQANAAIQTLRAASTLPGYGNYPSMDLEMATALFYQLNPDAITYYQRFISKTRGRSLVKESWQRMALCYYLQGNMTKAQEALARVKSEGNTQIDADKSALRFAKAGIFPNISILQARLLFDGGYYDDALAKLKALNPQSLTSMADRLEYYFRLGRIYDELRQPKEAAAHYRSAIELGRKRPEHFAARAALQLGVMLEKQGRKAEALAAFEECLSMRRHDFQANIDQQAKAGINRLTQ